MPTGRIGSASQTSARSGLLTRSPGRLMERRSPTAPLPPMSIRTSTSRTPMGLARPGSHAAVVVMPIRPRAGHQTGLGARLAFWSISDGAPNEIYVMNADGSGLAPVTAGASYDECRYISWSADGTRLAYCSQDDVYSAAVDGTGVSNLTNDALFEGEPRWSPRR